MARIRTIKPDFWSSEQVMECTRDTRLFFIGLWNFCDDHGRHPAQAKKLRALIFPGDDDVTQADVRRMIDELSTNRLIKLYSVENIEYIEVTGWSHQKIDRKQAPRFPPPFDDNSTNDRRMIDDRSLLEGKGREEEEEEEEERKEEEAHASSAGASVLPSVESQPPQVDQAQAATTPAVQLRRRIVLAYGGALSAPSDMGRVEMWIAQGFDPDISAGAIEAITSSGKRPVRLSYFDGPIRDAHQQRAPKIVSAPPPAPADPAKISPSRWLQLLDVWRTNRDWNTGRYGPPPGQDGCRVPDDLMSLDRERYGSAA